MNGPKWDKWQMLDFIVVFSNLAIEYDNAYKFTEAIAYYEKILVYLTLYLNSEKSVHTRELLISKYNEYDKRQKILIEFLKEEARKEKLYNKDNNMSQ